MALGHLFPPSKTRPDILQGPGRDPRDVPTVHVPSQTRTDIFPGTLAKKQRRTDSWLPIPETYRHFISTFFHSAVNVGTSLGRNHDCRYVSGGVLGGPRTRGRAHATLPPPGGSRAGTRGVPGCRRTKRWGRQLTSPPFLTSPPAATSPPFGQNLTSPPFRAGRHGCDRGFRFFLRKTINPADTGFSIKIDNFQNSDFFWFRRSPIC